MQPSQFNYPEFVADQVLTSTNLNDLFSYLDEQERLTRANLIGIGVVCGLEITVNAAGTQLTISPGCGITSGGYLVTYPGATLTEYKSYNAIKPINYEKFVNIPLQKQLYLLDQLFESAVTDGTTQLSNAYLQDKVVMLYVELLENSVKNCDPGSCDDKGKNVDISFIPLLISKTDAAALQTTASGYDNSGFQTLPILKLPRFNVPASILQSTTQLLEEYRKVLSTTLISNIQTALTKTYNILLPLIKDIYPNNPFATLNTDFAFINNNITALEATNLQYYYDLFSDIELAYSELRETGIEVFSMCCPDINLFRLHLLLGEAATGNPLVKSAYRQYFIPSPVMECHCKQTQQLRWLFKRIQLLLQNFYASFAASGNFGQIYNFGQLFNNTLNTTIKITPSSLGKFPLAKKAIPFYYLPVDGTDKLVDNWDIEKTAKGEADLNLSYNSNLYATEDSVLNPLNYDLEPYNFLRIEGHIGKSYTTALKSVINLRDTNRLPFDVVMLGTDLVSLKTALADLGKTNTVEHLVNKYADLTKGPCQFQDLNAQYDILIAEIICQLCKTTKYFYGLNYFQMDNPPAGVVSKLPLLHKCDPTYLVLPGTIGFLFERYYQDYKNYSINDVMFARLENQGYFNNDNNIYFRLILALENLYETFTSTLGNFDYNTFLLAYKRLIDVTGSVKDALTNPPVEGTADTVVQLDRLVALCILRPIEALYKDYLIRWIRVMMLQKFGYFARKHPGIQHKAGVPMGGTFIMVYHESPPNATTNTSAPAHGNIDVGNLPVFHGTSVKTSGNIVEEKASKAKAKVFKESDGTQASSFASGSVKDTMNTEQKAAAGSAVHAGSGQSFPMPSFNIGSISNINDLKIFAADNKIPFEDLLILWQLNDGGGSSIADVIPDIANGTVIADFYLPYLCCSDCPPIQYTVNEVQENVTISLNPATFCSGDSAAYVITVTPADSDVSGEGVSKDGSGKYVFTPSAVKFVNATDKSKDITLTNSAFGQSVTTKVTVFQKPVAEFTATAIGGGNVVTIVNNSSVYADKYTWDFGDTQTSIDKDPAPHTYDTDGPYTISLIAANGVCSSDKATQTFTITTPNVDIEMAKTEFCSDDPASYPITVSPEGTSVDGEGVTLLLNVGYQFSPSRVSLNGNPNKPIAITAKKGSKMNSIGVMVFQKPVASFTQHIFDSNPTDVILTNNSSAFATSVLWDFNDGSTSTEFSPGHHVYAAGGDYTISLTVYNESCQTTQTVPVTINLPKPSININPKEFCHRDDSNYPVITGPNGGLVQGESITLDDSGVYQFKPAGVNLNGAPQKVVTLTNTLNGFTVPVDVIVYEFPTGQFTYQANGLTVSFFSAGITPATQFNWSFDTQGTATGPNPMHTFTIPQTINVTVIATNGICQNTITQPVTVGQTVVTQPDKTCLPLSNAIKMFGDLKNVNTKYFTIFVKATKGQYQEMQAFFAAITDADSLSVADQITLFTQQNTVALLLKWITQLTAMFKEQITLASIIAKLIDILEELIEHIACIQSEDINKAQLPMVEPLTAILNFCNQFSTILSTATDIQKEQYAAALQLMNDLIADLNAEVGRTNANHENTTKPRYVALLKKIILAVPH